MRPRARGRGCRSRESAFPDTASDRGIEFGGAEMVEEAELTPDNALQS